MIIRYGTEHLADPFDVYLNPLFITHVYQDGTVISAVAPLDSSYCLPTINNDDIGILICCF